MSKQPVIYGFGSACVDYRIHIPDMGESYTQKVLADDIKELGGGACANCLTQAARLGADCTYLGKLGEDPQGQLIKSLFQEENIKTHLLKSEGRILSPFNLAIYKGALNQRVGGFLLPNSLGSITPDEATDLADVIEAGSSVIVELGEIPIESIIAFMKAAKTKGALNFMDVDLHPLKQMGATLEQFETAASLSDVLVPNYEAVMDLYDTESRSDLCALLHEKTGSTVIITFGENDIVYFDKTKGPGIVKVNKTITALDTVGAGDSFHGSLMYFMGRGYSIEHSINCASECAALACTGFGARTSMPYGSDIKHLL